MATSLSEFKSQINDNFSDIKNIQKQIISHLSENTTSISYGIEDRMNPPKNIFELTSRLENEINKFSPFNERSSDTGFSGISRYTEDYGKSGYSGFSGFSEDYGKSGYRVSGFSGYSGYSGFSGYSHFIDNTSNIPPKESETTELPTLRKIKMYQKF